MIDRDMEALNSIEKFQQNEFERGPIVTVTLALKVVRIEMTMVMPHMRLVGEGRTIGIAWNNLIEQPT